MSSNSPLIPPFLYPKLRERPSFSCVKMGLLNPCTQKVACFPIPLSDFSLSPSPSILLPFHPHVHNPFLHLPVHNSLYCSICLSTIPLFLHPNVQNNFTPPVIYPQSLNISIFLSTIPLTRHLPVHNPLIPLPIYTFTVPLLPYLSI